MSAEAVAIAAEPHTADYYGIEFAELTCAVDDVFQIPGDRYVFADEVPGLAELRVQERLGAYALLESRRNQQQAGEFISTPVDPLSTGRAVLLAGTVHGEDSQERKTVYDGLVLDSSRFLAEWNDRNRAGYYPTLRHTWDAELREYTSGGLSVTRMVDNGVVPIAGLPEEVTRRVNEKVEDVTPMLLRQALGGAALRGLKVMTTSECPDWALQRYQNDMAASRGYGNYMGYVPESDKRMVRWQWLDEATSDRMQMQVSLMGKYDTHEVLCETFRRCGLEVSDEVGRTELQGMQMLTYDEPVDFLKKKDQVTQEYWCNPNIFMGEEVPAEHPRDYQAFFRECEERQETMKDQAVLVAEYVLDLARNDTETNEALSALDEFTKRLMLTKAESDLEAASYMFGEKTVQGLREVVALEEAGLVEEAMKRREEVIRQAEGGGACGGGCGIEELDMGNESDRNLASLLKNAEGKQLGKSDKMKCGVCGSKGVGYKWDMKQYTTACGSCNSVKTTKSVISVGKQSDYTQAA